MRAQEPAPSPLSWNAPAGCPTKDDVLADVARLIGRPIAEAMPAQFHADVTVVSEDAQTFRASVTFSSDDEVREVRGESCTSVTEALTVMIAISIDPNAELVIGEPLPLDVRNTERIALDQPQAVVSRPPYAMHDRVVTPLDIRLDLSTGISHGILPGIGPGFGVGVGLRSYLLVAHAAFNFALPRNADTSVGRFSAMRGELAAGVTFLPSKAPLWIELLAVFDVARVESESVGVENPMPASALWVGLGLSTRFRYEVGSYVGAFLALSGTAGLNRPQFDVGGVGSVWEASAIDARAELGLSLRFGS